MSLLTPKWRVSRRLIAAALPVMALGAPGPVPLPVTGVFVSGTATTLVVDVDAEPDPGSVTVTRDGVVLPARIEPVLSPELAVTLVVDASSAGAAALPGWLSADARFVLGLPSGARAAVVADQAPATVVASAQRGPSEIVRALGEIRAGRDRDTGRALSLALTRFPSSADGRRVVLLCTGAPDAGGPPAAEVAARFRDEGVILVVVGRGDFWSVAAGGTGGFLAPAGEPGVVPALDQVEEVLAGRHLVRFTTPSRAGPVVVTVDDAQVVFRGEAVVTPERDDWAWWLMTPAALPALILLLWGVTRRSRERPSPAPIEARPNSMRPSPRGRARVIARSPVDAVDSHEP
ncbi:hypothetical protein ACTI_39130 [Actinoplanes sp. OR16]|uniref:vWA domain-containing protein n=1 Tax=Actinoplanes sp. OR16 TaxID=946334 RepID=UPI000F7064D2|nr:vWA domain-containing protein [Actinoplanes sp. OR16]BBH67228.1 hypothetical protein ACTI_39130 [Actinoplanes sp. OR16]